MIVRLVAIAAALGAFGFASWFYTMKAQIADLSHELDAVRSQLADCNVTVQNAKEHEERKDEVENTPNSDLGDLIHSEWMFAVPKQQP